jgi:2-polyprenyl-3-methyl-5-hydroxy-6-metoxy-1,4-benzoquinol methylase
MAATGSPALAAKLGVQLHQQFFEAIAWLPARWRRRTVATVFAGFYRRPDPWGYGSRTAEAARHEGIVASCAPLGATHLLDVGCGEGHLTGRLAESGAAGRITGVDVSAQAVERARAGHGGRARFVVGDVRDLDLPDDIDVALCADVLYYLGSRQVASLVDHLAQRVGPGGHLVLAHPQGRAPRLHAPARRHRLLCLADERHLGRPGEAVDLTVSTFSRIGASAPAG